MTSILTTTQLSKTFRGKKLRKVTALDDVSFSVQPGEVFGFLGPNGAGKSTAIKLLTGQIRPTSGSAKLFGRDCGLVSAREKLGYLPENPSFYDFLSAREYLHFVDKIFSMTYVQLKQRVEEALASLDLLHAADRPIRGYSKGMVQRLGMAQTLIHDPQLFILDEPMSGLDPIGRALVKDLIQQLRAKGRTVFFSTHITNDVELICDRFAILNRSCLRVVEETGSFNQIDADNYMILYTKDGIPHACETTLHQITAQLKELIGQGVIIKSVLPRKRSLEEYFLEVIRGDHQ